MLYCLIEGKNKKKVFETNCVTNYSYRCRREKKAKISCATKGSLRQCLVPEPGKPGYKGTRRLERTVNRFSFFQI